MIVGELLNAGERYPGCPQKTAETFENCRSVTETAGIVHYSSCNSQLLVGRAISSYLRHVDLTEFRGA